MKQTFDILIRAEAQGLATILQVLEGAAALISVTPTEAAKLATRRRPHARKGGTNGTTGRDIILKVLADGRPHPMKDLERAFKDNGLNPKSASPASSFLINKDKLVRRTENNLLQMVSK